MPILVVAYCLVGSALGATGLMIGLDRESGAPMVAMMAILVLLSVVLMLLRVGACRPLAWIVLFWHLLAGGIPLLVVALDSDLALDATRAIAQVMWIIGAVLIVYIAHRKEVAHWLGRAE